MLEHSVPLCMSKAQKQNSRVSKTLQLTSNERHIRNFFNLNTWMFCLISYFDAHNGWVVSFRFVRSDKKRAFRGFSSFLLTSSRYSPRNVGKTAQLEYWMNVIASSWGMSFAVVKIVKWQAFSVANLWHCSLPHSKTNDNVLQFYKSSLERRNSF